MSVIPTSRLMDETVSSPKLAADADDQTQYQTLERLKKAPPFGEHDAAEPVHEKAS